MIRLLVRTAVALLANAVALIVAAIVLDKMSLNVTGFLTAVVIFTIVFALLQPFTATQFRRRSSLLLWIVSLVAALAGLIVADIVSDGLSIHGLTTWIAAAAIVWLVSALAAFVLPFLGLRRYLAARD